MIEKEFFAVAFKSLVDVDSNYPWQFDLFERLIQDHIPKHCGVPTGLGKTSVIPIWVLALAWQAMRNEKVILPRRLVYVVNRRTVVDQATTAAEAIAAKLAAPSTEELKWVANALCGLSTTPQALGGKPPLAISTLRGQLADNEEWKKDLARPAIIVGTVDMVGSRLLFNGYGDGRWKRSFHAGLLGQDVLYVHDEAHLSPAFEAFSEMLRVFRRTILSD